MKQGADRLIRRESDTGLLVICDTRLTQMGYGRRLLAALPPMRRITNPAEFDAALAAPARPVGEQGNWASNRPPAHVQ